MGNELFRQSALQTLANPEQLDRRIVIAPPRAWIALAAFALILGAVLLWSLLGYLPSTVAGEGILIRPGGIYNVLAEGNGMVVELRRLKLGDTVHKGQRLGRIQQSELALQVGAAAMELQRLQTEEADVTKLIDAQQTARQAARQLQREALQAIVHAKQEHLHSLHKVKQSYAALLRDGLITNQTYEQTQQDIYNAENAINDAKNQLQQLGIEKLGTEDQYSERLRKLRAQIAASQDHLRELELREQHATDILSPSDGNIIEIMVARNGHVDVGQPLVRIESGDTDLAAIVFLPPTSDANLLKPGMTARISPATYQKERYGYLLGKVNHVAKYPATEAGMMAVLDNATLVDNLSRSGAPISVSVDLIRDPNSKSGYAWSSDAGAQVQISSGTLASGSFIVETKHPISLLLPWLRKVTGL